jgi:predicted N-acyltransferase
MGQISGASSRAGAIQGSLGIRIPRFTAGGACGTDKAARGFNAADTTSGHCEGAANAADAVASSATEGHSGGASREHR